MIAWLSVSDPATGAAAWCPWPAAAWVPGCLVIIPRSLDLLSTIGDRAPDPRRRAW